MGNAKALFSCRITIMRRLAFTLVELLVFVAIFTILAALLLPVLKRSYDLTKRTACISNLHQLGIAIQLYSADNNGIWPHYIITANDDNGDWSTSCFWDVNGGANPSGWEGIGRVYPYLHASRVFFCPSDNINRRYLKYDWENLPAGSPLFCSYVVRGWAQSYSGADSPGKKLLDVKNRALVSCFFMYSPVFGTGGLTFHGGNYPVLFGGGYVKIAPMPAFIIPSSLPDIWNTTSAQFRFWDSFDKVD